MMLLKKKQPTFLFYDYETFGLHTAFDKPAQFACIRTDINFNVIDKPQCFYCFPPDDYLPDPQSVLITRITPQYTQKNGTNEYNFSKKIYDLFTVSNTCIVGYNNINFDDEITRNIFYRNFFDSYEWSWKNGNSRWDLLNLVRACYALRPSGIHWPKNELGLTSFKLSDLTRANNISHVYAHDAISDVYATISIARLIKQKKPKLFNFFFKNRKKTELFKLIDTTKFKSIIYVTSHFGMLRKNVSCILPIAWKKKSNNNILIAIDLFKDIKKLILFFKNVSFNQYDNIKILFDLGIVLLYMNRCPMIAPIQVIRKKDYKRLKLDNNLYNRKVEYLKKNSNIIQYIKILFSCKIYEKKKIDVDLKIYDAFFDSYDKKKINIIRKTKPIFLEKIHVNFHDIRLKNLFFRYRARNFFHTLNNDEKKKWIKHCLKIFNLFSLQEYTNKVQELLKKHFDDLEKTALLHDLLDYACQKYKILIYKEKELK